MSGLAFLIVFAFFVLIPVFRISKLRLPDNEKLPYMVVSVAIPIIIFLLGRLAVTSGILSHSLIDQSPVEKFLTWLIIALIWFGSWIVYIYASYKQPNREAQMEEKKDVSGES